MGLKLSQQDSTARSLCGAADACLPVFILQNYLDLAAAGSKLDRFQLIAGLLCHARLYNCRSSAAREQARALVCYN